MAIALKCTCPIIRTATSLHINFTRFKFGDIFNSLEAARTYVEGYLFDEILAGSESFDSGTYRFKTVTDAANFTKNAGFCGDGVAGANSLKFTDKYGVSTQFGNSAFFANSEDNEIMGNPSFGEQAFANSNGNNKFGNCNFAAFAFQTAYGINEFGNCTFGDYAFNGYGSAFTPSIVKINSAEMASSCFADSVNVKLIVLNSILFTDGAFAGSSDCEVDIRNSADFGQNAFAEASTSKIIYISKLNNCSWSFANNFSGAFKFDSLGSTIEQDLPTDIFTTTNDCIVYLPYVYKFINGDLPEGDVASILQNMTGRHSKVLYNAGSEPIRIDVDTNGDNGSQYTINIGAVMSDTDYLISAITPLHQDTGMLKWWINETDKYTDNFIITFSSVLDPSQVLRFSCLVFPSK